MKRAQVQFRRAAAFFAVVIGGTGASAFLAQSGVEGNAVHGVVGISGEIALPLPPTASGVPPAMTGMSIHGPMMRHREHADMLVTGPLLVRQALEHADGGPPPVYPPVP